LTKAGGRPRPLPLGQVVAGERVLEVVRDLRQDAVEFVGVQMAQLLLRALDAAPLVQEMDPPPAPASSGSGAAQARFGQPWEKVSADCASFVRQQAM
jgi:hypothetical protein